MITDNKIEKEFNKMIKEEFAECQKNTTDNHQHNITDILRTWQPEHKS